MTKINLTEAQFSFIKDENRHVYLSGGIASGKTFTMIEKIIKLVELKNIDIVVYCKNKEHAKYIMYILQDKLIDNYGVLKFTDNKIQIIDTNIHIKSSFHIIKKADYSFICDINLYDDDIMLSNYKKINDKTNIGIYSNGTPTIKSKYKNTELWYGLAYYLFVDKKNKLNNSNIYYLSTYENKFLNYNYISTLKCICKNRIESIHGEYDKKLIKKLEDNQIEFKIRELIKDLEVLLTDKELNIFKLNLGNYYYLNDFLSDEHPYSIMDQVSRSISDDKLRDKMLKLIEIYTK